MTSNPPLRACLAALVGAAFSGLLAMPDATARASFDSPYALDATFSAALRLVRVDRGFKITEKDPQAAYVLFEYRSSESGDRITQGAIEMIQAQQSVKVVIQLAQMPRYHEQVLADALAKKLRDDYGEPPPRPAAPPSASPPPDGGAD